MYHTQSVHHRSSAVSFPVALRRTHTSACCSTLWCYMHGWRYPTTVRCTAHNCQTSDSNAMYIEPCTCRSTRLKHSPSACEIRQH